MVPAVVNPQLLVLDVAAIRLDPECQPRVRLDPGVIGDYADGYRSGRSFPPLVVFNEGSQFFLADGWHRFKALLMAGRRQAEVEVRLGRRRDAILYAVGANATHGLRRTIDDKRRAVEILLKDPEWHKRSDGWIADMAQVSQPFVGKMRRVLTGSSTASHNVLGCEDRIGKNGKTYTVPVAPESIVNHHPHHNGSPVFLASALASPLASPGPDDLDELTLPEDEPGLDDPDAGSEDPIEVPDDDRSDDCDADDGGPAHISEAFAAWLETLPVRPELTGEALVIFDSDACLFRDMRGVIEEFAGRARTLLREHDKRGAYHAAVRRFLSLRKPLSWVACPSPSSGGCGGSGEVGGVRCHACRGRGYRLDGVASQAQIAYLKRLGVEDGAALDPGTASDLITARRRANGNCK